MMGVVGWNNGARHRSEEHESNIALTPTWLVERIRDDVFAGTIDFDPCTQPDNPCGATRFVCKPDDGILTPWPSGRIYCNPPYTSTLAMWVQKCVDAGHGGGQVVLLVPARPETRWSQLAMSKASDVLFFRSRLKFGKFGTLGGRKGASASFPSVLYGFGVSLMPLADLGLRMAAKAAGGKADG